MRRFLMSAVLACSLLAVSAVAHAANVRLFVQHKVTDYAAWRKVYDGFDATRRKLGVVHQEVWRVDGDPNNVVIIHDFATLEKAKAFTGSDELKTTMQKAGVAGEPVIWFTTAGTK